MKDNIKIPPLGITPEWLWLDKREEALEQAIEKRKKEGKEIPPEWERELKKYNTCNDCDIPPKFFRWFYTSATFLLATLLNWLVATGSHPDVTKIYILAIVNTLIITFAGDSISKLYLKTKKNGRSEI